MNVVTNHLHRFKTHWSSRVFYVQLSTTESEPQRGPHDSEVDNSGPKKNWTREEIAAHLPYTLISSPHGPLTRRYTPTTGKPLSGPLRPRTEAFSSLTGHMASQGRRGTGDIRTTVPAYAGFTPVLHVTNVLQYHQRTSQTAPPIFSFHPQIKWVVKE